jgi:hypothetical protein
MLPDAISVFVTHEIVFSAFSSPCFQKLIWLGYAHAGWPELVAPRFSSSRVAWFLTWGEGAPCCRAGGAQVVWTPSGGQANRSATGPATKQSRSKSRHQHLDIRPIFSTLSTPCLNRPLSRFATFRLCLSAWHQTIESQSPHWGR